MMKNCKPLTVSQIKRTNGCGSSTWYAWPFRIPKWLVSDFYLPCCRHDLRYQQELPLDKKSFALYYRADFHGTIKGLTEKAFYDDELYNGWYYAIYNKAPRKYRWLLCKIADFGYWCLNTKMSDACYKNAI